MKQAPKGSPKRRQKQARYHSTLQRGEDDRFRALVDSVDGIVWEADATNFQFIFVSQKAEGLLGYPLQEWHKPGFWEEHIHPDDREHATSFCLQSTLARLNHEFEYRFVGSRGQIVWVRDLVSVVTEHGLPKTLRGIMVDITHQKEIERALVESERRFKVLFESNIIGIMISTFDGKVIEGNEVFIELSGCSKEDLRLGRVRLDRITPQEYRTHTEECIRKDSREGILRSFSKPISPKGR